MTIHVPQKIILALHASICLCITCINSFIAYHENDLEILMVATVFSDFKSDHRIERYRMIKYAKPTVNMHCVQVESTTHDQFKLILIG